MIIGHVSDIHGDLAKLPRNGEQPDVWILTGDILPNEAWDPAEVDAEKEREFQEAWIEENAATFVQVFGNTPVIVIGGNHDFADLARVLGSFLIDTRQVTPEGVMVKGYRFSGFREVRYMQGYWNGEERDFASLVDRTIASNPDFLVTHAPPAGILDDDNGMGHGGGISDLTTALAYREHAVQAHFFGHIHDHGGKDEEQMGIRFYNGAGTVRFITI